MFDRFFDCHFHYFPVYHLTMAPNRTTARTISTSSTSTQSSGSFPDDGYHSQSQFDDHGTQTSSDEEDTLHPPELRTQHSSSSSGFSSDSEQYDSMDSVGSTSSGGSFVSYMSDLVRDFYGPNNKATQTYKDPLYQQAEMIALDVIQYLVAHPGAELQKDKVCVAMRQYVDQMLREHEILLNGMMNRLHVNPDTGYEMFTTVANELFEEEKMRNGQQSECINWGRIVALYAFGGRLAKYCKDNHMDRFAFEIARFVGQYVGEHLISFIREEGGWEALTREFPIHEDLEQKVRKGLLVVGLGLGLSAAYIATH